MTAKSDDAIQAITGQQATLKARSAPWMVGEQLKDMVRREPGIAQMIAQDLTVGGMSLTAAEAKIKAFADKHRTGNFACVTPQEAETIIREYFGLTEAGPASVGSAHTFRQGKAEKGEIDLADFF